MRRRRGREEAPPAPSGSPRAAALRLLGRRDYTAAELTRRLIERGHAPDEVEAALQRLAGEGLVDDRRVAAAFIRVASRVKGRGRIRIERDLLARGVAAGIVRDALAALPEDEDADAVRRILARRGIPDRITLAERRKLFRQLLRRGFPAEAISKALRLPEIEE
jgi:regulatory protein